MAIGDVMMGVAGEKLEAGPVFVGDKGKLTADYADYITTIGVATGGKIADRMRKIAQ